MLSTTCRCSSTTATSPSSSSTWNWPEWYTPAPTRPSSRCSVSSSEAAGSPPVTATPVRRSRWVGSTGGPHQGQPIGLGTAVRQLVGEHDAVGIRLQAQRCHQVPPPAPAEGDLVQVHARGVAPQHPLALPAGEGLGGGLVVGAGPA